MTGGYLWQRSYSGAWGGWLGERRAGVPGLINVASNKPDKHKELTSKKSKKPLCKHTEDALKNYFATLNGDRPGDLYDLVLGEVERPLFKAVMDYTDGNQSQAAGILGINRGTLRKKLRTYSLIQ
jgi:Fis family transcriptional regulator